MSTPERTRAYQSRRTHELLYESPFRRARRDTRIADYIDVSRNISPSPKQGTRSRYDFGQTRTLRGAFQAASRATTMSDGEDLPPARSKTTPSPRRRQQRTVSPGSALSSPPDELLETYQRINDAHSLADLVEQEDSYFEHEEPRGIQHRRLSSAPTMREHATGARYPYSSGLNFMDEEAADDTHRSKLADHAKDEQRLKRATTSHSPVFSRAKVGVKTNLTAESLHRRDEEIQDATEDSRDPEPSLNLPRSWGSRGRSRDWLSRRNESESRKDQPATLMNTKFGSEIDSNARSLRTSERPPVLRDSENQYDLGNQKTDDAASNRREVPAKHFPSEQVQQSTEGDPIPNTPIVVYKNSTFNKPSPTNRDSQELLRKLARTESPNEIKTPEQQKPPGSRIYDKTPVVTGAWVDTPATERPAELPEHLSKNIVQPAKATQQPEKPAEPEAIEPPKNETKRPEIQSEQKKPEQKDPEPRRTEQRTTERKKRQPLIKPKLPKSGLATVIEDAKSDKDSALGDDTLESLQQLLLEEPPAEAKSEEEDDAAYERAILKKLEFAASKGQESVDLDRLNAKLQSLVRNISEVQKGLTSLEDQVSHDSVVLASRGATTQTKGKKKVQQHVHTGEGCESCGASDDGRVYAAVPLPRLWRRDRVSRRIRPTRLGWGLIIFVTWFISESTMCDYYCHPLMARVCERNCLLPDAPRFPFVIPTMLWRWSHLSTLLAPLFTILVALLRLVAQLLGLWDGYVDDDSLSHPAVLTGEILIRGTPITDLPGLVPFPTRNVVTPVTNGWQEPTRPHGHGIVVDQAVPTLHWEEDPYSMEDDEILS